MNLSTVKKYYKKDIRKLVKFLTNNNINKNIILMNNTIGNISDVQKKFDHLRKNSNAETRVVVIYYNHLWEPLLKLASFFGFRKKESEQNWLNEEDIKSLFYLSGFEVITSQKRMLIPIYIPLISNLINKYLAFLPIINSICLTTYCVAKTKTDLYRECSVSIIIPAKNEAGNINKIVSNIPRFGKWQEIIFVEGNSTDNTWDVIQKETNKKYGNHISIKSFKQKGEGKADAVRLGFLKARGEILMIYDADRTVEAKDLLKFYNVLFSGKGEFVNGSRMVYPTEKDAMRTLNMIGNKLFSILFTWILGQRFKDTLCGTKALFKKDYLKFKRVKNDPFGDFELIFGAISNNLKVIEIPVRYKERIYGSTNISRFKHGLQLFKITWIAFKTFKAW